MAEFNQYHEPPNELSESVRTFARVLASLVEEAEEQVEGQARQHNPAD